MDKLACYFYISGISIHLQISLKIIEIAFITACNAC
jgi:hypothetical protein